MRIDFKPQRLVQHLAVEEKVAGTVRRLIAAPKGKTIDMTLTNIDSLGNVYPKGYYVSSYRTYDKTGMLEKSMDRNVTGTANSESVVKKTKKDMTGKFAGYSTTTIVRNNKNITMCEADK